MLQLACIIPVSSCNTASGLKRKPVTMSFLGVGAPEAVLVGIVALVVFGPKGLAEAAKSVGKTLRSFQPTIKEIAEVTQDLKGTLEKELGLDEIRSAARPPPRPMPTTYEDLPVAEGPEAGIVPARLQAATEELARQADPDIEAKRAMSADMAWGGGAAQQPAQQSTAAAGPRAAAAGKDLASMSVEDLEAELARRRSNATAEKQRT